MKKTVSIMLMLGLILFGSAGMAGAMSYSETFLGAVDDSNYYEVWEGYRARFAFDLTGTGGKARLFDANGDVILSSVQNPTTDETTFVAPGNISSALLNFTFSSEDIWDETVRIKAGVHDGDLKIYEGEFDLGYWTLCTGSVRQYADLNIDLISLGLGSYVSDGKFLTLVIAPDVYCLVDNDFRIDQANLVVTTPEPTTLLLLGFGLLGVAGIRRFKK